eukprot:scaffold4610_cov180-Ochromonas_danica.AAC.5
MVRHQHKMTMTTEAESAPVAPPKVSRSNQNFDFSVYSPGQEHEGTIMNVQPFGVFVRISNGPDVLLPRSQLNKNSYERLKKLFEEKSTELIKFSLISVSPESKTLSGKLLTGPVKGRADLSALEGKEIEGKLFTGSVVSVHDFGIFVLVDELGVQGLVPISKAERPEDGDLESAYLPGSKIDVIVEEVNIANQKLVLAMKGAKASHGKNDDAFLSTLPQGKWIQAIVQSVNKFALFLRPAAHDKTIFLHQNYVPRDLIRALKKRLPDIYQASNITAALGGKSDLETLFGKGDVLKVRVDYFPGNDRSYRISMLPLRNRASEDEDANLDLGDDVEGGATAEVNDISGGEVNEFDEEFKSYEDDDEELEEFFDEEGDNRRDVYDAESLLVWWRGAPYERIEEPSEVVEEEGEVEIEELQVINEDANMVDGNWRRLFEVDMRADALDSNTRMIEADQNELREEIGELEGLDEGIQDAGGFGVASNSNFRLGSFFSFEGIPEEWKKEMDYFAETSAVDSTISSKLRGGQKAEQTEFESLMRELQQQEDAAKVRVSRSAEQVAQPIQPAESQ